MATTVGRLSDILVSLIWPCLIHPQLFPLSISSISVSVVGLGSAPVQDKALGKLPLGRAEVCTDSLGFTGNFRQCWECLGRICMDPIPISGSASTGVGTGEFKAQRPFSCSWGCLKGEQYLLNLTINMAFDNNVTKNLFWYNSKPHSSVWNFVGDLLRVPFPLRIPGQWQPLAALPTSDPQICHLRDTGVY